MLHHHARFASANLGEGVVADGDGFGAALDVDYRTAFGGVVDEGVVLNAVAMPGEVGAALGAEEDAVELAVADGVAGDEVVGVAMADGDADAVALDRVLLGEAVFDAPAEEDADVVSAQGVVANDGPLPLIPHF